MAEGLVFRGAFDGSGAFRPDPPDADRMARARRKLAGKRAEVVFRRPRSKRSLDQNAYAHAWPFRLLAEHFGDSVEGVKLDLLGECFGWTAAPITKRLVPVKPHTSALTVEEFSHFIDWMVIFGASNGVVIPLPSEVEA
jgi:hypothetical protein